MKVCIPSQCKSCPETNLNKFRQRTIKGKLYYIKICRLCELNKSKEYYSSHKEESKKSQDNYRKRNKEIIKEKKRIYDYEHYRNNIEKYTFYYKTYRLKNKDQINLKKINKRKSNPAYRLRYYISNRIRKTLFFSQIKKKDSCLKFLNYSFNELKLYIEKQFIGENSWMNWDNHGVYDPKIWKDDDSSTWTWQLDHILPQSDLPYTSMKDENFKKCWALENLRPLSARQNLLDGVNRLRHL